MSTHVRYSMSSNLTFIRTCDEILNEYVEALQLQTLTIPLAPLTQLHTC